MAADKASLEDEIDRLYGLSPEQFTPERDGLAKRLRSERQREAADQIKGLRKPTVAAWALNQLRRQDPAAVEALIAAGEQLRNAQERLLAAGELGALREAAASERALVERLAQASERLLADAGHPVSAATQTRLWATLRSVAGDAEARELLSTGRLVRDYEVSDLGLGLGSGGAARVAAAGSPGRSGAGSAGRAARAGVAAPAARAGVAAPEQDRARRSAEAAVARKVRSVEQ
jgi:hypothetical protein